MLFFNAATPPVHTTPDGGTVEWQTIVITIAIVVAIILICLIPLLVKSKAAKREEAKDKLEKQSNGLISLIEVISKFQSIDKAVAFSSGDDTKSCIALYGNISEIDQARITVACADSLKEFSKYKLYFIPDITDEELLKKIDDTGFIIYKKQ